MNQEDEKEIQGVIDHVTAGQKKGALTTIAVGAGMTQLQGWIGLTPAGAYFYGAVVMVIGALILRDAFMTDKKVRKNAIYRMEYARKIEDISTRYHIPKKEIENILSGWPLNRRDFKEKYGITLDVIHEEFRNLRVI